eukprot:1977169-Rhodomonas_salina.1
MNKTELHLQPDDSQTSAEAAQGFPEGGEQPQIGEGLPRMQFTAYAYARNIIKDEQLTMTLVRVKLLHVCEVRSGEKALLVSYGECFWQWLGMGRGWSIRKVSSKSSLYCRCEA